MIHTGASRRIVGFKTKQKNQTDSLRGVGGRERAVYRGYFDGKCATYFLDGVFEFGKMHTFERRLCGKIIKNTCNLSC